MVRAKGPTGLNPLRYLGVEAVTPPNLTIQTRVPTANDSIGYNIGDLWLRYRAGFPNAGTASDLYILVGVERDVAHWVNFIDGVGLQTLTGDAGGVVSPDGADNINILGDAASNLTTLGNPGANSITVNTVSGNPVGTDYVTDLGTAFPGATGQLNIITNQAARTCGNTVLFAGAGNTVNLLVTDAQNNTTIGNFSGSTAITTGNNNTSVGGLSLTAFTSGSSNTALGYEALQFDVTGDRNTAVGEQALIFNDDGDNNTAIGYHALTFANSATAKENTAAGSFSLNQLATGERNIAIGFNAGLNYVGAESNNIILYDSGTLGESNTIRIGTEGTQTAAYMAGINGVTVANEANVVIDSVTGQLGVGGSSGAAGDNAFLATFNGNVTYADVTGAPATYFFGTAAPAGAGNAVLTVVLDPDGVIFPGDGLVGGVPFSMTAPANGTYLLWFQLKWTDAGPLTPIDYDVVVTSVTYPRTFRYQYQLSGGGGSVLKDCTRQIMTQMDAGDTLTISISSTFTVPTNYRIQGDSAGPITSSMIGGYRIA